MADRIAENADLIVDEMKRKARRRLVGAIVLALAAAIILPMLLEKEPRPLGDDVSVKIPPVDESKFVNRLTGKASSEKALPKVDGKTESKSPGTKAEAAPESAPPTRVPTASPLVSVTPAVSGSADAAPANKSVTDAEQRVLAPSSKVPAKATAEAAPAPESKIEPKAAATEGKVANSDPKPITVAAQSAAPPAMPPKAEGFVVQLAAFADDKGANSLANKLKKVGYAAFVEPVQTSRGTLWRVRVGGYSSRPDAEAARAKLKGEGYNGIVAPVS